MQMTEHAEWVEDGILLRTPGTDKRRVKWQAWFGQKNGHVQWRLEYDAVLGQWKWIYEREIKREVEPLAEDPRSCHVRHRLTGPDF